jgi:hypothetical protein
MNLDLGPIEFPILHVPGSLFPELKRMWREADHSHPSTAEVKNGGAIPPLPIRLHDIVLY